ncbi:hypothetical protein ACFX2I_001969 [Malus domestica]|uniref:Uncharacterized protein n=1 Tax=Malus domestica TaxID=3750 RepID=A0A498KRW4_MALDO|nr:hypothetical protein DVH24_022546 [Malus domestica]
MRIIGHFSFRHLAERVTAFVNLEWKEKKSMEVAKPKGVEIAKGHVTARPHGAPRPPSSAQQKPKPKSTTTSSLPPRRKKRKPITNFNMDLHLHHHHHHSPHFKICALVHRLRPRFIEILRTPDFRNCKAADEIRKELKLLMELHKQMAKDTGTQRKFVPEHQHPSRGSEPAKENQDGKGPQQLQPRCSVQNSVQGNSTRPALLSANKKPVDFKLQGSYIVGGSAFGWNFITFSAGSTKPVYYGVTKEAYRSGNDRLGDANLAITTEFSDCTSSVAV